MAIPLLGLLLAGGALAGKPYYENWAAGVRGRAAEDALSGAGDDPLSQARALMGAGLIDPQEFVGLGPQLDQLRLGRDRLQEDIRQFGLTHQLGLDRLGLDQGRLDLDRDRMQIERARTAAGAYEPTPFAGPVTPEIMAAAKDAIAGNESRGHANPYAALGPVVRGGDRAYGKYQVMGANIPSWTMRALGVQMTPEEFLQDPEAQEAVFEDRFGGALDRYGNFEDAASEWFTGRPFAQAARETPGGDGYMRTADYVGQAGQAFGRTLGLRDYERQQASGLRETELAATEAGGALRDAADSADVILQGMDDLSRIGALNSPEGKAVTDQVKLAGTEMYYAWRKSVYGEAEPNPDTDAAFQEVFRNPGGTLEDRERTTRYFQTMRAEMLRKAEYEEARELYKAGLITRAQLQGLNGGRLTREERARINRGDYAPEGWDLVDELGG